MNQKPYTFQDMLPGQGQIKIHSAFEILKSKWLSFVGQSDYLHVNLFQFPRRSGFLKPESGFTQKIYDVKKNKKNKKQIMKLNAY